MAKILIGGGTGLVGTHLSELLSDRGYEVAHLSRRADPTAKYPAFQWDPAQMRIDPAALEGVDYVVNLAGAGIADKPWTTARKQLIIDSRVDSTRLLLEAIQRSGHTPKAYLSSAGIGYYGNRGDQELTETAPPGEGFLPEICQAWESAIAEVAAAGIRTLAFRIGLVLTTRGGALPKIMLPMKGGLATYFGGGQQWYSWIHIQDLSRFFLYALEHEEMAGTYNAVAPNPVRNKDFTETLRRVKGGFSVPAPAPAFALRLALGEMADTILDSTRVSARKAQDAGFVFEFETLEEALSDLLTNGH